MTARNMAVLVLAGTDKNADYVAGELKKEGLPAEHAVNPRKLSIGKFTLPRGLFRQALNIHTHFSDLLPQERPREPRENTQ